MSFLNRAELIGNLGRDPEIRTFQNGGKVANLRIATTRKWKDRDGNVQEETEWHSVAVTSEGLVRVVEQYTRKGSKIYVSGRLRTRKWQDQSGQDRYSTEILVGGYDGRVILLDGRQGGGSGGGYGGDQGGGYANQGDAGGPPPSQDIDDEIPF